MRSLHQFHFVTIVLFIAIVVTFAGCGPGRGDIVGTVTFEKRTVKSGSVVVRGGDGMTHGGEITLEGTFEIKGVVISEVSAIVHSPDPGAYKTIPRKKDQPADPPKDRTHWFPIPEKFGDFDKSGLKLKMRAGKNTWNIELAN